MLKSLGWVSRSQITSLNEALYFLMAIKYPFGVRYQRYGLKGNPKPSSAGHIFLFIEAIYYINSRMPS